MCQSPKIRTKLDKISKVSGGREEDDGDDGGWFGRGWVRSNLLLPIYRITTSNFLNSRGVGAVLVFGKPLAAIITLAISLSATDLSLGAIAIVRRIK